LNEIILDNITFHVSQLNYWDDERVGSSAIGIEPNMLKRFINECRWSDDLKVPPHYYKEDLENLCIKSTHDCVNPDTHIVLMNWLTNKKRKYKLDYRADDPFWLFHDYCHSQGDVYSYQVNNINAFVEHYRIIEGAEMAKHYGYLIKPATVEGIINEWSGRFRGESTKIYISDFEPYMSKEDFESIDCMI
jgi:hypothetical protein